MDANDTLGCLRSTRNLAEVFWLTWGYHNPAALIRVRNLGPFPRSSVSRAVGEPHSARERNPAVAMWFSPQKEKFDSCEAPMTSEKCVNQMAKG